MKGRKPKPKAMKILAGTFREDRANPHEPVAPAAVPDCPLHLSDDARQEWFRVCGVLAKMGILSEHYRTPLAMYCAAYARWANAEKEVREGGEIVKSPNGYPIQNPYLAVANKAMEQMIKLAPEFGMSPSSLSRVHSQPEQKQGVASRKRTA